MNPPRPPTAIIIELTAERGDCESLLHLNSSLEIGKPALHRSWTLHVERLFAHPHEARHRLIGVGVILALAGSLLLGLGFNLVTHAAMHQERRGWFYGLALIALAHACALAALVFAPSWVVWLVGALALIWCEPTARTFCKAKHLGGRALFAIGIIFVALALLAGATFVRRGALWTAHDLGRRWHEMRWVWIVYGIVTAAVLILFAVHELFVCRWQAKACGAGARWRYRWVKHPDWPPIACSSAHLMRMTLLYAGAAGLLASWSAIFFESLAVLIQAYMRDGSRYPLRDGAVLFYTLGTVLTMVLSLHVLARVLCFECICAAPSRRLHAHALLAVYLVVLYSGAVGLGAIHYGTFQYLCYIWPLVVAIVALLVAWLAMLLLLAAERRECDRAVVVVSVEPYEYPSMPAPPPLPPVLPAPPLPPPPPPAPPLPPPRSSGTYGESAFMRAFRRADSDQSGDLDQQEFSKFLNLVGEAREGPTDSGPAPERIRVPGYSFYSPSILHTTGASGERAPAPTTPVTSPQSRPLG